MNDFTKEELNQLLEAFVYWHEGIETRLFDKLRAMIDNYCSHESMNDIKNCVDCGISEFRCTKCGYVSYEGPE